MRLLRESKSKERREDGREKNRWVDWVLQNVKYLAISNWCILVTNKEMWRENPRELLGSL
jgi:hypothetical protein